MAKGKYKQWLTFEGITKLKGWAKDGLTDELIAGKMGIHVATLYEYKKKYADIDEALKKGKEVADYEVEDTMYKKATGKCFIVKQKEVLVEGKMVIVERTTEQLPPDTTAAIFWLKNRKPDKWREKKELDINGDMDLKIVVDYGENIESTD